MKYRHYEDIVNVKVVSYTQPSKEFDFLIDGDKTILNLVAFCARVSNPNNQNNTKTSEKLIDYLIKNMHWSPMESCNVCLEITSTRDIIRQLLRHRSFSFQEFSQRYSNPVKELEFCLRENRFQDLKNRQNSIQIENDNFNVKWLDIQEKHIDNCVEIYEKAIAAGVAKEVARVILPEGNTVSKCYCNGTIRSWIHYLQVRTGNGTQKEHMMIAEACAKVIFTLFPIDVNNLLEEKKN